MPPMIHECVLLPGYNAACSLACPLEPKQSKIGNLHTAVIDLGGSKSTFHDKKQEDRLQASGRQ